MQQSGMSDGERVGLGSISGAIKTENYELSVSVSVLVSVAAAAFELPFSFLLVSN